MRLFQRLALDKNYHTIEPEVMAVRSNINLILVKGQ